MAWISTFPNYRHGLPMGGNGNPASRTPSGVSFKACLPATSRLMHDDAIPCLTSVHAEENGNQRKLIE